MADMTLEEALAAATVDEELVTPVNEVLLINPETRSINVPDSEKLFGARQDMNAERKYFKCPRIVGDNIDLSEHRIFINYVPSKQDGTYDPKEDVQGYWCKDLAVEGDFVTFSWKLSENVTRNAGYIAFAVYAKTIDEYGNLQTKWHTTIAIGNVLDTLPDGEEWITVYPDIVMQLLERMDEVEKIATPESMQGYVDDYFNRNPMMIDRELKDATKAAPADIVGKLSEENAELKGDLIDTVKGKEDTLLLSLVSGTTYKKTFNFSCNAGDIITFTLEDKSILTDSFFICISTDTETDIIIFSDTGEKAYIMPYNCNEFTVFVTGSYINSTGEISIGIKKTGYNSRFLENEKRINTLENSTKVIGDYIFVTDNSSMKEALKTGGTIVISEGRTNITEIIEVPVNKFISIQGVSKNSFLWFAQNAQLKFTSGDDSRATVEFKNLTLHTTATRSIPIIACDGISCPTFIGVESQLNAVKGAINDIEIKNGTRLFIDACVFRYTRISITDNSDNKIQNSWIWSQTQEQAIKLIRAGNTTIHNVDIVPCLTYNIDNWLKYSDFTSEQFDNAKNGCGIYAEKCSELSIDNCLFDGGVVNGNDLNTARMVVAYYCSGLTISNCKTYHAKNDVIVIKDCYTSKIVNNSFGSCNILKTGGRAIAVYKGDITQPEIIISGNTFNTIDLDNLDLTGLVKSPLVYIESGLYPIKMVISDNLIWTKSGADGSMYKSISKIFDIDYNYQTISLEDNKSTVGVFRVNKNLSISSGETSVEVSYSMEQIPRNIVITARNSNGTKVFVETVTNTNCKFSIPEIMDTSADFYVDISY